MCEVTVGNSMEVSETLKKQNYYMIQQFHPQVYVWGKKKKKGKH